MSRKTQEDLLNPQRLFYRLIKDYTVGKLDKETNYHRAVVVAVDTIGGQLEKDPPNPQGSIRARVYTNGLDATTPSFALNIFHPFLSFNAMPPVAPGEHVLVTYEDPVLKSNGMWIRTIPYTQEQDFGDPNSDMSVEPDSSNTFEGTSPNQSYSVNKDLEFGRSSNSDAIKNVGPLLYSESSFFKGKNVFVFGDETCSGNIEQELKTALFAKEVEKIDFYSVKGSTIDYWSKNVGVDLALNKPDVVLIFLGLNDSTVNREKLDNLMKQLSDVKNFFWFGPVKLATTQQPKLKGRDQALESVSQSLEQYLVNYYVETRSLCSEDGRTSDGIFFTGLTVTYFVDSILSKAEGMAPHD